MVRAFLTTLLLSSLFITSAPSSGEAQQRRYTLPEIHAFAMAQLEEAQKASFSDDREYCGLIGLDRHGVLTATPANRGKRSGCRLKGRPWRFKTIASYHTHGAYNRLADTEVPSVSDLKNDFKQRINGYVGTPGGRVWFNNLGSEMSVLLCGPGCIETDPNFIECPSTTPRESYTIDQLRWREENVNEPC